MVITCEQCQARFRLADEKLKPEGTKVRCSKCKLVFSVFPPEISPAGEVSAGVDFNPNQGAKESTAPAPLPADSPAYIPVAAPPASQEPPPASGETDLDFSGLEESMGPGPGGSELAEDFSFADTSVAAVEPPAAEGFAQKPAEDDFAESASTGDDQGFGELDFDATFAESEEPPAVIASAAGPAEFAFDQELAQGGAAEIYPEGTTFDFTPEPESSGPGEFDFTTAAEAPVAGEFNFAAESEVSEPGEIDFAAAPETFAAGEFNFATEPEASGPGEFDFTAAPETSLPAATDTAPEPAAAGGEFEFAPEESAPGLSEFGFETEAGEEPPAFGEEAPAAEETTGFEFGSGDSFESSALSAEQAFGEAESSWDQPAAGEGLSFDFDEPNFETKNQGRVSKGRDEAGLSFGEIDFSDDDDAEKVPGFGSEPDFSQAAMAPAPVPEPLPVPPPPPPSPRPEARRPHSGEAAPVPFRPRKSPVSRTMAGMAALLLILCGAGGYLYFTGKGQQLVDSILLKIKGEAPAAPVEQLIALSIDGSSYVKNREAGQLLVVQGTATNNFPSTRTAISVKGVLLDATGKALQQQTVFCGNYLDEAKLRSMRYLQIEEAMNNQFGDSLSNMNVNPGKVLRFTIVFRNVPKEMANINVEVVDSKPGG